MAQMVLEVSKWRLASSPRNVYDEELTVFYLLRLFACVPHEKHAASPRSYSHRPRSELGQRSVVQTCADARIRFPSLSALATRQTSLPSRNLNLCSSCCGCDHVRIFVHNYTVSTKAAGYDSADCLDQLLQHPGRLAKSAEVTQTYRVSFVTGLSHSFVRLSYPALSSQHRPCLSR